MTEPTQPPAPPAEEKKLPGEPMPPPRKRRLWLWIAGIVVVGLLLLILIVPTLLGMGFARAIVVSQVNKRINGQLQVDSWSLGWFSSIGVQGISIKDESGRQILQLPRLQTHLSLLDVIRGKYALGDIKIEKLDMLVVRAPDGTINWTKLAKPSTESTTAPTSAAKAPASSEPIKLPNISGHVILADCSATFEDQTPGGKPIQLRAMQTDINIPDINQAIANSFSARVRIGTNAPGAVSASGSVGAVAANVLSIDSANVDETLKIDGIDLAIVSSFLGKSDLLVNGRGQTTATIKLTNGSAGSASLRSSLENVAIAQGPPAARKEILTPDSITAVIDAAFTNSASGRSIHLSQLQVSDSQKLFSIAKSTNNEFAINLPSSGDPSGSGSIDLSADVKRLSAIAQAMGPAPTTQPMEITSGSANGTVQVSTEGAALHVKPRMTIANLAARQGEKQYAVSSITLDSDATITSSASSNADHDIHIAKNSLDIHDLVLDGNPCVEKLFHVGLEGAFQTSAGTLNLQNLTLAASDSKAISVVLKGRVTHLFDQRAIDNALTADIDYDLDPLLKLVKPFLSADLQERLKDASAAGKYLKHFEVRGAYPANQPFNQAVQSLAASGELQVDKFEGAGASLSNLTLPITLVQGYARLIYADKPTGQNLAAPAGLNGGTVFLGGTQIDLRTSPPTVSTLQNIKLLDKVALNPVFASWTLGTFLADPVFVGADKATGSVSIILENCDQLPLSSDLTTSKKGTAALNMQIHNLTLSNKFLDQLAATSHTDPSNYRGELQLHEAVAQGVVTHNMTLSLGQGLRSIGMHGTVQLADRQMKMVVSLPWKLLGLKNAPKELISAFPESVDLPLTGTVENPKLAFDFNRLMQQSALKGLTGQGGGTTQPDDPLKAIGDLINNATKKKKNQPDQ